MTKTSLATFAVAILTAACSGDPSPPAPGTSAAPAATSFSPDACALAVQAPATWTRTCGRVRVAVSRRRGADAATNLDLYVERFSRGPGPTVAYLTGGPGIGLDAYAGLGVLTKMLSALNGEVLLIEQRGNARSPGRLTCTPAEETRACLARLTTEGAHPEDYNTVESAADVVDVLDALRVPKVVLWGHSYGSGLAQFVAQKYPDRVASVLLEGVSDPLTPRAGSPIPARLATLTSFGTWYSSRCAADASCKLAYPSGLKPASEVEQLIMTAGNDAGYKLPLSAGQSLSMADVEAWFLNGLATYDGMLAFSQLVYAHNRSTPTDASAMSGWLTAVGRGSATDGARAIRGFVEKLAASTVAVTSAVKSCFDLNSFGADAACDPLARDVYTADAFKLDAHIALPTLFLNGVLDTQTLPAETDLVRPRFTKPKEVLLPGCVGHFSYLDGGVCADEVVKAFLAGEDHVLPPSCAAETICAALPLVPRLAP